MNQDENYARRAAYFDKHGSTLSGYSPFKVFLEGCMYESKYLIQQIPKIIAQKLRMKMGKFQLARDAVADWIEEGKWEEK